MANILIVDDHSINRQFLSKLLGYFGHSTIEARDGLEALKAAHDHSPDAILSDIHMPKMDGREFVGRLRQMPAFAGIPVAFVTATYRLEDAQALAAGVGVEHVIGKPIEVQDLVTVLKSLLGGAPAHAASADRAKAAEASKEDLVEWELMALRLAGLVELGIDLATKREARELVRYLCRALCPIMHARRAAVVVLDENRNKVLHCSTEGLAKKTTLEVGEVLTGLPVVKAIMDPQHQGAFHSVDSAIKLMGLQASEPRPLNALAMPICLQDEILGWVCVTDRQGPKGFVAEDERLLVSITMQAAVCYENAYMNSRIGDYLRYLEKERHSLLTEQESREH